MHNKKKCVRCKYHGFFGSRSYGTSEETFGRTMICEYAKITNKTCLYSDHGKVLDRRGTDPDNCLLFERGERVAGNKFNTDERKRK